MSQKLKKSNRKRKNSDKPQCQPLQEARKKAIIQRRRSAANKSIEKRNEAEVQTNFRDNFSAPLPTPNKLASFIVNWTSLRCFGVIQNGYALSQRI